MLSTIVLIALTVGCLGGEDKSEIPAIYVTPVLVLDDEEIIVEPGRVVAISGNVAPIVNESCVVDLISMGDSVGSATILQNDGGFSITVNGLFDESDIIVQVQCSRSGDLEPQTVRSVVHSDEATTQTDGMERLSEILTFIEWIDALNQGLFAPPTPSGSAAFQSEKTSFEVSWTSVPLRVNWTWDITEVGAFERIAIADQRSTTVTRIDNHEALRNLTLHPTSIDLGVSHVESVRSSCGNKSLAESELSRPLGCVTDNRNLSFPVTVSAMVEMLHLEEAILTLIPTTDRTRYRTEGSGVVLDIVHHIDETVDGIVIWRQDGIQKARMTISLGEAQEITIPEGSVRASFISQRGNLSAENGTNWSLPFNISSNISLQRIIIEVHQSHVMTDWSVEVLAQINLGTNGQGEERGWSAAYEASHEFGKGWNGILRLVGPVSVQNQIRILIIDTWSEAPGWGEPSVNRSDNKTFDRVMEANQMIGAEIDMFVEQGVEFCWRWTSPKNGTGDLHTHIGDEKPSFMTFDGPSGQRCWTTNETLPLSIIFRPNSVGVNVHLEVWGDVQEMFL